MRRDESEKIVAFSSHHVKRGIFGLKTKARPVEETGRAFLLCEFSGRKPVYRRATDPRPAR